MHSPYLKDKKQWQEDIKGRIPMPDFSLQRGEYLNPYLDTTFLIFFITRRCNLNCSFCYLNLSDYKTDFSDHTYDATAKQVHRLMKKPIIRRINGVSLFGGEPLVNQNLEEIIDAFKQYNKDISITTNGLLLRENATLLKRTDRISVSVYVNTIDKLSGILSELAEQKRFVLTFALTKTILIGNADILDKLMLLGRAVNAECVCVFTVAPSGRKENGEEDDSEAIYHGTPEGSLYEARAAELKAKYPDVASLFYAPQRKVITEKTKCTFAWWYICCDAFGNVSPCACALPPARKYGNVFKDGFEMTRTFNCKAIRAARGYFGQPTSSDVPKLCRNCIHLYRDTL